MYSLQARKAPQYNDFSTRKPNTDMRQSISFKAPEDIKKYIVEQAGKHRMSVSEYVLRLVKAGVETEYLNATADRLEALEARIEDVRGGSGKSDATKSQKRLLEEVLRVRFMAEQQLLLGHRSTADEVMSAAEGYVKREMLKLTKG